MLSAALLLIATITPAQQALFTNQQHFGVEDGLPQSYISGILQDEDGFIWMSTLDGFCRYDGRGFMTFRYNANDTGGLAANAINNLVPQVNNIVTLFYSPTQADDFNLRTFQITRNTSRNKLLNIPNIYWPVFGNNINSANWFFMLADYKGVGWLNSKTEKIYYANRANGLLEEDTVCAMTQSTEGRLYLVSENGVHVSDTSRKKFDFIHFDTKVSKRPLALFGDSYSENYGIVCLAQNRLAVIDTNKLIILDISSRSSKVYSIPPSTLGAKRGLSLPNVDAIGQLYFTNAGRVFRLTETGELKLLWENTTMPSLRTSAVFIDRSDVLWVSVNAQGVCKVDLHILPFQAYKYSGGFISDIMKHAAGQQAAFPPGWNVAEGSYNFRQAYDSKGNLFTCLNWPNQNELYQLNTAGLRMLPHKPESTTYSAILVMPDDAIWVFNETGTAWYRWDTPGAIPKKIPLDKAQLEGVILADSKYVGGFIWFSTYNNGLLQYQGARRLHQFAGKLANGIMPGTLTEICIDPLDKNKFWIGSRGGGMILWDAQNGLQHVYTMADGLPNNTVYCILPDKEGNIWGSTNKGIFRMNVTSKQVTAFEKADGLSDNEFNRAHKLILPNGQLAFGGLEGYTIFNPGDFNTGKKTGAVPVLLTGLQINNQSQLVDGPARIIKESLSTISLIHLPYDKNYLRFEFAAMLFNQPQKTKYRYQLKGTDKEWVESGTSNIASYAALRPGSYVFRINATDDNGFWGNTVKEIKIIIHPPFWATWWAYLFYILTVASLVRWYFIFREKRLKAEQSLAFEKREALRLKEADEMKDRFFSNITHEFRTPLTLIINPLEKLLKDSSLPTAAVDTVKAAQRNSRQLLRLINEFLDFSKLNDGQLKVRMATGQLHLFTADCVQSFQEAAREKRIQLEFYSNGVSGFYSFDEEKWEKIVTNLVSNALKFAPNGGKVSVFLSSAMLDTIELTVEDNGPGIPADQQQKIFNRFYQVDDSATRRLGGTGIGLSLVKELTELMQGSIELDSKPGCNTRFTVKLSMRTVDAPGAIEPTTGMRNEVKMNGMDSADKPLLLVVEDNPELRTFLVNGMSMQYRVLEAADGLKAWELVLEELPDLVISDVMMPGQDGFDLCRLCKTDTRTAHIGFILLTSKAAHEARLEGLGIGADDYIIKPFSFDELLLRSTNLLQLQGKLRAWLQAQLISTSPQHPEARITDPFILQIYGEMDAKLADAELGVDYLCKTMAMSRSTLNRKLKSLLDMSANDLIRQYRLKKATGLLSSGVDITTVAYQVGFSSPSYFSQCFKEQYRITPSEFVQSRSGEN